MVENFREILACQGRLFRNAVMRDFLAFNREYTDHSGFPFLETTSKEYEIQKYFEKRLEHYTRVILVNDVFRLSLEYKGVGVYMSEINNQNQGCVFYTNIEYEDIAKYEFTADYGDSTVMYRYTDISDENGREMLSDFVDELVVMQWDIPSRIIDNKVNDTDGLVHRTCIRDFFAKHIGLEEYEEYITFLTGIIIEFQEFIGAKSAPKLSPFSMGAFRFEVEKNIITFTEKIREYIAADEKISQMKVDGVDGILYGYRIIDEDNRIRFPNLETDTKLLASKIGLLDKFVNDNRILLLIGGKDYSRSLITSEYLYKQYDCDDCFDYTAVVSGYLKSVEQLLFHIVCFAKDKGLRIKSNGKKMPDGNFPPSSRKEGNVFKIDLTKNNLEYVDTTIGSLIHFLDDNKSSLLAVDQIYRQTVIDALNCYRIECRNNSFHLDNNYNWSRVEFIRWNTFFIYLLLLEGCKLGDTTGEMNEELVSISDNRLERLFYMISSGIEGVFEFVFEGDGLEMETMQVRHVADESSFPSYDNIGRIISVLLTFERITDHRRVIITRNNVPTEIWYVDDTGKKELIT